MTTSQVGKRRQFPRMVAGSTAPVEAADVDQLRELRAELVRMHGRISRATERIRRQLGTAETGVDGQGVAIVRRRQSKTGGAYVRMNHRDDLDLNTPGAP